MTETPHEISSRLSPLRDKIINPATRGLRPRFARNYFEPRVQCSIACNAAVFYIRELKLALKASDRFAEPPDLISVKVGRGRWVRKGEKTNVGKGCENEKHPLS